jgi:hypothetical protein
MFEDHDAELKKLKEQMERIKLAKKRHLARNTSIPDVKTFETKSNEPPPIVTAPVLSKHEELRRRGAAAMAKADEVLGQVPSKTGAPEPPKKAKTIEVITAKGTLAVDANDPFVSDVERMLRDRIRLKKKQGAGVTKPRRTAPNKERATKPLQHYTAASVLVSREEGSSHHEQKRLTDLVLRGTTPASTESLTKTIVRAVAILDLVETAPTRAVAGEAHREYVEACERRYAFFKSKRTTWRIKAGARGPDPRNAKAKFQAKVLFIAILVDSADVNIETLRGLYGISAKDIVWLKRKLGDTETPEFTSVMNILCSARLNEEQPPSIRDYGPWPEPSAVASVADTENDASQEDARIIEFNLRKAFEKAKQEASSLLSDAKHQFKNGVRRGVSKVSQETSELFAKALKEIDELMGKDKPAIRSSNAMEAAQFANYALAEIDAKKGLDQEGKEEAIVQLARDVAAARHDISKEVVPQPLRRPAPPPPQRREVSKPATNDHSSFISA